jgi:hypothetical protein
MEEDRKWVQDFFYRFAIRSSGGADDDLLRKLAAVRKPLEQRIVALVLSYETKVEDLARETLRSSELARLLSEARDVLVTDGHDGLHHRHCARCSLTEESRVALGCSLAETP